MTRLRRYFLAALCVPLVLSGCAQFFGKTARRGAHIVVRADSRVPLSYQIILPSSAAKTTGFDSSQPIEQTSETPTMFSVGRFIIRYRCGQQYQDFNAQFRRADEPQVINLTC